MLLELGQKGGLMVWESLGPTEWALFTLQLLRLILHDRIMEYQCWQLKSDSESESDISTDLD